MPFRARHAVAACAALCVCAVPAVAMAATRSVKTTESEFKIAVSRKSGGHGKVKFTVKNAGDTEHEFVVIKTSTKASKLKVTGSHASEKGNVGEVEDIAPGKTKSLSLNLAKGHYALICNLPGHYKQGMHLDFTVS
jgi:uncharacterized cupredoxin-like copper-binding protein